MFFGLLATMTMANQAACAELESVDVSREKSRFTVISRMIVNAPTDKAFAALVDYDRFHQLSDSYVDSRYLPPANNGTPRVYTRVEGCISFFCKAIERSALLVATPLSQISASVEVEPGGSLNYGLEVWQLETHPNGTLITYRHEIEPAFWIPPVIGPWAIRRMLTWAALAAAQIIEDMAQADNFTPLAQSPCSPTTRPAESAP